MNENYPVFDKWYRILSWIMDMCEKYPKSVRFSLSGRIASMSIDIIESIIEAIYAKKRCHILRRINLYMEKLRVLFRLSCDRKYISVKQYEYITREINEAGKMIGGWIKSCKE